MVNDPIGWLFGLIFNFLGWAVGWCAYGVRCLVIRGVSASGTRSVETSSALKSQQGEAERLAGCRDVVIGYIRQLGYVARQVMSRDEIEKLIDNGISPNALAQEIQNRIDEYPGIILGEHTNIHHKIKLPYTYRNRHMYMIGRSGSGKTNTIRQMIMQDIENGYGVATIAPEAEMLTEEILPYISDERIDDVVYFNPADMEYPIPINPLHLDADEDIDQCVDDLITIFMRLSDDISPRMREIMYHAFYGLMERKGSTLLDVEILLDKTDPSLRDEIIATTENPRTARFFEKVFPTLPRDATIPVYTRIGQLVSPKRVRNLLCQPGKSFNFRQAMDDGRILLFNLSDGILGEQTSQLLGQLVVTKIQQAVFSRADTSKHQRRPFYLYLDEFQAFVGDNQSSYEKILSRSRKYNFGVCLANQATSQIPDDLLQGILGNVSTLLVFEVASRDAEKFSKELIFDFGNVVEELPSYELLRLRVGQAWGKIGKTVFPLTTPLADQKPDMGRAKEVIERSRLNYGISSGKPPRRPETPERPFLEIPDIDDDDAIDHSRVFE